MVIIGGRAAGGAEQARRSISGTAPLAQAKADAEGSSDDADEVVRENGGGGFVKKGVRVGRPFLDPRAPRRQASIRDDPRHAEWGGMIDILEHSAYCDGQREEDPDGFFFDETRAEYDSDCDGDPFSNGYLTEDEIEFTEDYVPGPYIPGRIVDQIWFLFSVRGYSVHQLSNRYRIASERVSAIIALKKTEPEMIATGRYSAAIDQHFVELYGEGEWKAQAGSQENWAPDYDMGVNYNILRDDQMPDDVYPIIRRGGHVLRKGHVLPKLPQPARDDRLHKSRFAFTDTSAKAKNGMYGKALKIRVSDYNGEVRPASNMEALYRPTQSRYWGVEREKGPNGLPFKEEDATAPVHGPKGFIIPP